MSRRAARGQKLPPTEVELLNSLNPDQRTDRVKQLYEASWPLQAIGEALQPKHPRSTVRSWVQRADGSHVIDAPIPMPELKTTEEYQKVRPESPGIRPGDYNQIQQLAPLARTYRSRMASTSAPAVANQRLTDLCKQLHNENVSIRELAEAAGVTYRAMYKRVML